MSPSTSASGRPVLETYWRTMVARTLSSRSAVERISAEDPTQLAQGLCTMSRADGFIRTSSAVSAK